MRARRAIAAFGIVSLVGTSPTVVLAAVPGAQKCAAAKLKAAGKKAYGKIKCHQKAITKSVAVDSECLTKAETKFLADIVKADAAGTCSGTAADLEDQVDAFVAALVANIQAVPTTTMPPTTSTTTTPTTSTSSTQEAPGPVGCCNLGGVACAWLPADQCTHGPPVNGTPGAPGSVCDSATGTCTLTTATPGNCCTLAADGGPSPASFCIASPLITSTAICLAEGELIGPAFTSATVIAGVCPSPGVACVP